LNSIYHLPGVASPTGFAGKILDGWWVSGILTLQGGVPFTPCLGSNRSRSANSNGSACVDRPDLVPGRSNYAGITSGTSAGCGTLGQTGNGYAPAGAPLGTPSMYFDPCAFMVPAAGFLGTSGYDTLRGPGLKNLDFSIVKDTPLKLLGESGKVEFRTE